MAARREPVGGSVSVQAKADVKATDLSSESEDTEFSTETSNEDQADSKDTELTDLDDKDLETLGDLKKIPYTRFKEVNESVKVLKRQLELKDREYQDTLRRAVEDAELRVQARLEKSKQDSELESLDPYERDTRQLRSQIQKLEAQLSSIQGETQETKLQSQLERLEKKYPEADALAVLGWKKAQPHADLEELMEKSHNRELEKAETKLKRILEEKKKRAKQAIPTRESGIRLKDSERPKSIKDASALFRKLTGMGG
jgi:hypothetical protein